MENSALSVNSVNSIKQPTPKIEKSSSKNKNQTEIQRTFNTPKVGVVDVPDISKTPLQDTFNLKRKENPKTAYKITTKNYRLPKFALFLSFNSILFGIIALFNLKK